MKLVTEVTCEMPQEVMYFDQLEMKAVAAGLQIKAKSPVFAGWIKASEAQKDSSGGTKLPTWSYQGKRFYYPSERWNYNQPYGFAFSGANQNFFAEERPNLLFLFHTELEEGAEMLIPKPISLNNLEDYFTSSSHAIQSIWSKELRQVILSAVFKEVVL